MIKRLQNYQILDMIGRGGMATVYRARDRRGNIVAVKVMHAFLADSPEYVERFWREAQTAKLLDSPHIVKVLDLGREQKAYFMVMEYVPGPTVAQLAQQHGALSVPLALDIAAQVCMALQTAYEHGVVHRDIKPQNMKVTPDGIVKVMDFGIARVTGFQTMTQDGMFMGSPHYVSPEQAEGRRVDIRSDLYSLGIVLYELLTGTVPFRADTPWAVLAQHVKTEPVRIDRLRVDLPPEVAQVVHKAMAKDPAQRYQTPAEMLGALRAVGATRRTPAASGWETQSSSRAQPLGYARPLGAPEAPAQQRRAVPVWLQALLGTLAGGAIVGLVILFASYAPPPTAPTMTPVPAAAVMEASAPPAVDTATATPSPTSTATGTATATPTATNTPTASATATATATASATASATSTPTLTVTRYIPPPPTNTATSTPTATSEPCPGWLPKIPAGKALVVFKDFVNYCVLVHVPNPHQYITVCDRDPSKSRQSQVLILPPGFYKLELSIHDTLTHFDAEGSATIGNLAAGHIWEVPIQLTDVSNRILGAQPWEPIYPASCYQ